MFFNIYSFIIIFFININIYPDDIYLLKYAESFYPAKFLNVSKNEGLRKIGWFFYFIQTEKKQILVDTGVCDTEEIKKFRLKNYINPMELLKKVNITKETPLDIILTHSHFDHIGCINYFENAKFYIQNSELIDLKNSNQFKNYTKAFKDLNKVVLVDKELELDSYKIKLSGGHTIGSQYIYSKDIMITGDECYFIENCLKSIGLPEKARFSESKNLKFIDNLIIQKELNPKLFILSMHDPNLLNKFVKIEDNVYIYKTDKIW